MSVDFSLIVPTIGRKREVERLLESITLMDYDKDSLEVIIVDQNRENLLGEIINKYASSLNILHLRVNFRGAAKARNYGLKFAKGKYIHFPDDDSFYERDTLGKVKFLLDSSNYDAVAIKVLDPVTKRNALLKFYDKEAKVNCLNFFKITIEFNVFWRRNVLNILNGFDENLGVGTYFSSEESGDLILRALRCGYSIFYTPNIVIYHLDKRNADNEKIYKYALGFGALLRKHLKGWNLCILPYAISYVGKSFLGVILYFTFDKRKFLKYKSRLLGALRGYVESKGIY